MHHFVVALSIALAASVAYAVPIGYAGDHRRSLNLLGARYDPIPRSDVDPSLNFGLLGKRENIKFGAAILARGDAEYEAANGYPGGPSPGGDI